VTGADVQEVIAIGIVALVVGIAIWRRRRRSAGSASGCGNCDTPQTKPKEAPLRFYRRRP
jgi:hypothetical protein